MVSETLDWAWRAVVDALPEGWVLSGVNRNLGSDGTSSEWLADADGPKPRDYVHAKGDTPVAALRALAIELHRRPR